MLAQGVWLSLSIPLRQKLALIFDIPKRAGSHIIDGKIASDGYAPEDLARCVTLEKLQAYVGEKSTNFYELFDKAVLKAEGKEEIKNDGTQEISTKEGGNQSSAVGKDAPRKRGRKKTGTG